MNSYDDNQMICVLRICPQCDLPFFMRPEHVICVECRGWQPIPKVGGTVPRRRLVDCQGNPIDGP